MNAAIEASLAKFREDFIENTLERIQFLDQIISAMRSGIGFDVSLRELKHNLHSIKGLGSTAGFPSITRISHRLEDYIEVTAHIETEHLDIIQLYLGRIRDIAKSEEDAPESEMSRLLHPGILDAQAIAGSQTTRVINMLIVMPRNLQRKIIGQELTSCGFQLTMVEHPLEAIAMAVRDQPDVVFCTLEMPDLSGADLVRALSVIAVTKHQRTVLMTTSDDERLAAQNLPPSTFVVRKGPHFFEELMKCLVEHGVFGALRVSA